MQNHAADQALVQNLRDAGCDGKTVARFLQLLEEENTEEQLALLSLHRRRLLARVHREEKRIDCLDYLVSPIQQKAAGSVSRN